MTLAEIVKVSPGDSTYSRLKGGVLFKNTQSARDLLYVCAWFNLRRDRTLEPRQRVALLDALMKTPIKVEIE